MSDRLTSDEVWLHPHVTKQLPLWVTRTPRGVRPFRTEDYRQTAAMLKGVSEVVIRASVDDLMMGRVDYADLTYAQGVMREEERAASPEPCASCGEKHGTSFRDLAERTGHDGWRATYALYRAIVHTANILATTLRLAPADPPQFDNSDEEEGLREALQELLQSLSEVPADGEES